MAKKNSQNKATSKVVESTSDISPENPVINTSWVIGGLLVFIFLAYAKIWENGLVWDDDPYITLNDAVTNFNLKELLTGFHVGNYHPVTMLSLAAEYAIVGDAPWLYHLDNLILHTINSFLVFLLIRKLTKQDWVAVSTAALFALHPLHVESVAWAAERKDLLYTFFLFLSFGSYLLYQESKDKVKYILSLFLFLMACLSKGMAVVLPALLLITDWWFLDKKFTIKNLLDKFPFFIITLFFAWLATTAQKEAGADASNVIGAAYTFSERIRIVTYSFLFYWVKTIIPINLLPFYPYPGKAGGSIPVIYNFALIAFIITALFVFIIGKKNKWIWWSFAFFTISVSTVLQIIPVGSAIVADRYYYLSSIGPLFLISYLLFGLSKNTKIWSRYVAAFLVLGCSFLTFSQVPHWKNGFTLFKPAEKFYPEDAMVISNIGWYYLGQKEFPLAKEYLMRADNNGFKNADVCRTIGSMYIDEGHYEDALIYVKKAYEYLPVKSRTDWLMALALYKLNRNEEALVYAEKAAKEEPENLEYLNTLSQVLSATGNYSRARELNKKLLAEKPDLLDAKLNYAYSFRQEGKLEREMEELKALIKEAPDYLPAYRNLGVTYSDLGRHDDAVELWERASKIDSTGDYEYNIGINYAMRNRVNDAIPWYQKAAKKGKKEAIDLLMQNGQSF